MLCNSLCKYLLCLPLNTSDTSLEGQPVVGSAYPERRYPRDAFLKEERLAEILAELNSTYQEALGHQRHEMILDCIYSGFNCSYQ